MEVVGTESQLKLDSYSVLVSSLFLPWCSILEDSLLITRIGEEGVGWIGYLNVVVELKGFASSARATGLSRAGAFSLLRWSSHSARLY